MSKDIENVLFGIVKSGRGPRESEFLTASTKSITGDTLYFFSHANQKFIQVDKYGTVTDLNIYDKEFSLMGFSFAFNHDFIAFPVEPKFSRDFLIKIYNIKSLEFQSAIEMRVPFGSQPSVRNEISAICSIPDGFALTFIGDRKIYLINFNGEILQELILGTSDEIKIEKERELNSEPSVATPYLTKMEYVNGTLFTLMEGELWKIDYKSKNPINIINFYNAEDNKIKPLDFSISDSNLFVRLGRSGIASTKVTKFIEE